MPDSVAAGKFLSRELEQHDPTFYETVYPEYWGAEGKHHPAIGDLDIGTRGIVASRLDMVGEGVLYDGTSTDIPLADFGIEEAEYNTRIVISGAEWTLFDLEAQRKANTSALLPSRDIIQTKVEAMRMAIDRRMHRLVWAGDRDMQGLFNHADIEIKTISTDLYSLSPADLYDFFLDEITDFQDDSELTAEVTDIKVPLKLKRALLKRFLQNGDRNPFALLTSQAEGIAVRSLEVVNELKADLLEEYGVNPPGTGYDRIMIGELNNPRAIRRQFYSINRTEAREVDGMRWRVFGFAGTSEVQVRQPFRLRFLDIPRAA